MAKRVVTRVYRLRHAGSTSGWGYHMPSDGPTWFATRKAAQAYAAKMARTGGSFGRPFSTTIEPFGPSVGWASSNESRESNLRDAESALGVQFRRSGQPRRVGAKRKAGGKTSARKRVPSKRVANPDDIDAKTKFTLRREPPNSGGYDRYGEYFGRGAPLFVYEGEVPTSSRDVYGDTHRSQRDVRGHVRAADRQDAMAKIRQKYPMARFFGEKRKVANPSEKSGKVTRVRVKIIGPLGHLVKSWIVNVRDAGNDYNATVRARIKARQHSEYVTGDHIEAEVVAPSRRKAR